MGFDFPNSPTVGQTWPTTPVTGQPVYTWDGEKWTSASGTGPIYVNDNAPAALPGSLWWESDTGILHVLYYDGNSTQWVAIGGWTDGAVRFDTVQSLTTPQQTQAKANIGLSAPISVAQGGTSDTGTAWTLYTPTVSMSSGSGSATGRYKQIGKTV